MLKFTTYSIHTCVNKDRCLLFTAILQVQPTLSSSLCFTSSQNSRMEFMIANSLHESWTILQAKYSVKQHQIQNYFYADILTTRTTLKFSLAFLNTAPCQPNVLKNSEINISTLTFTQLQYGAKLKTTKLHFRCKNGHVANKSSGI